MSGAPIGRRRVFESIMSSLAGPKQELILIAGPAGSGRTHLLKHVAAAAGQLGYSVLAGTDAEPVTIEPSTTIADIQLRIERLTGADTPDPGLMAPQPRASGLAEAKHIAGTLRRLAPLLVVIDGFRPSVAFQTWFISRLVPRLRATREPVSAVIADRAEALEPLGRLADLTVPLGRLDADEARIHLRDAAKGLSPGLTPEELEQYVQATVAEPARFSALLTVFEACGQRGAGILR